MSIQFLSFDIDDTLLPSHEHYDGFHRFWDRIQFEHAPLLCYNTGRLKDDTLRLIQNQEIPGPDYLICGVGTQIYDFNKGELIKEFSQILEQGWNVNKVTEIIKSAPFSIKKQALQYQNPYKSSWFLHQASEEDINKIRKLFRTNGMDVNVIYSSQRHLDILPKWANKGNSLEWLIRYLGISPDETLVAGNSGNDAAMFTLPGIKGILVGNTQPELLEQVKGSDVFLSKKLYEEAIEEGFRHYGVAFKVDYKETEPEQEKLFKIYGLDTSSVTDSEQLNLIQIGYGKALEALRRNITPIGFSAFSIADNELSKGDTYFRSVWARDAAMSIIGTTFLIDREDIEACQRKTLETLIDNISEHGQVPNRVNIDTLLPDYSGVNNICTIDSGLWLIIAFHDYVKASGDLNFLREKMPSIDRVMNWLMAHDSNNDALLEIPEAGDWINRKGRSYNVMYDEILWYRANVCMGRLYELLNEEVKTGKYITWSQVIKNAILSQFWPSRLVGSGEVFGFSGDAEYLIAQRTPFGYSLRCDILGNILAYIYDVVDNKKALQTFRFVWNIGASDPYPVKNIYPAILTEDPDNRQYNNENLHNLPHHYHNGGIWPFVGGAWVRYINKLGMKELAIKEMVKLAELNQLGKHNDWEFNEWHHGITGRPSGNRYQAWSASEYLYACHELGLDQ